MNSALKLRGRSGLMLAVDLLDLDDCMSLIESCRNSIDAVKIGAVLLTSPQGGFKAVKQIKETFSIPILVDGKIHDVQHVVLTTIRNLVETGASAVTVWQWVGKDTLNSCQEEFPNVEIVVLTALTAAPYAEVADDVRQGVRRIAEAGCTLAQVPGNHEGAVRAARQAAPDLTILCCGMGIQGGLAGEAIAEGADYEIVGRDIYNAARPKEAAAKWKACISEAMAHRSESPQKTRTA